MANSFNISRGNSRSNVGEDQDIRRVDIQSPHTLIPQTSVIIEDCGIPLGCDSPGDSFRGGNPCDSLDLTIYNVMGQEDKNRQEDGTRVNRGGIGRIVVTTTATTNIEIDYSSNPSDEDNPALGQTWTDFEEGKRYHEVFVPVNPDSLYAFRVRATSDQCPDIQEESGIYYFSTGSEIVLEPEPGDIATFEISLLSIGGSILKTVGFTSGQDDTLPTGSLTMSFEETIEIKTLSTTILQNNASNFSTSFTTS